MKPHRHHLILTAILGLFLVTVSAHPAGEPGDHGDPVEDLRILFTKIQSKLQEGVQTEAEIAPEIAEFDALLTKYAGHKTDEVAQILYMKMALYMQVFQNEEKGLELLRQLKADFPGSSQAGTADQIIATIERNAASKAVHQALIGKPAPALTLEWSSDEGISSLAALKGKVVVLDFWATWCGPCLTSFPDVAEMVSHYQGYDVEVIGVTSIQGQVHNLEAQPINVRGDPAREMSLMPAFMKAHNITWTVVFTKEAVFNEAYGIRGIPYMAIIAPDGTVRHAGLHPAMPHAQKVAMIDALLKEFNLKTPEA